MTLFRGVLKKDFGCLKIVSVPEPGPGPPRGVGARRGAEFARICAYLARVQSCITAMPHRQNYYWLLGLYAGIIIFLIDFGSRFGCLLGSILELLGAQVGSKMPLATRFLSKS